MLPQCGQAGHDGEQHRLDHVGAAGRRRVRRAAQHAEHVPVQELGEGLGAAGGLGGEDRGLLQQFAGHAWPLAALPAEDEHDRAGRGHAGDHVRVLARGLVAARVGEGRQPRRQVVPVGAEHGDPVLQRGAGDRERQPDVGRRVLGPVREVGEQPPGLVAQGGLGAGGEHPRQWPAGVRGRGLRPRVVRRGGGLLDDHVGVGAADAEGRHPGPARAPVGRPLALGLQQPHRPGRPVHKGRRPFRVQRARQRLVPHRLDHLDHPGDAAWPTPS